MEQGGYDRYLGRERKEKKNILITLLVAAFVVLAIIATFGAFGIILFVRNRIQTGSFIPKVMVIDSNHVPARNRFELELRSLFIPASKLKIFIMDSTSLDRGRINIAADLDTKVMIRDYVHMYIKASIEAHTDLDRNKFSRILRDHGIDMPVNGAIDTWNFYTVMSSSYPQDDIPFPPGMEVIGYAVRATGSNYCEILKGWEGLLGSVGSDTAPVMHRFDSDDDDVMLREAYQFHRLREYAGYTVDFVSFRDSTFAYDRVGKEVRLYEGRRLDASVKAQILNLVYILSLNGFRMGDDCMISDVFVSSSKPNATISVWVRGGKKTIDTYGDHILIIPSPKMMHYVYDDIELDDINPETELPNSVRKFMGIGPDEVVDVPLLIEKYAKIAETKGQ